MKKRYINFVYVGISLLVSCLVTILYVGAVSAEQKTWNLIGYDRGDPNSANRDSKVVLTMTEYKPGIYTVTGTLYIDSGRVACPIKGNYNQKTGKLNGIAKDIQFNSELNVDGENRVSAGGLSEGLYITIKHPGSNLIYFDDKVSFVDNKASSTDALPTRDTEPKDKNPSAEAKPEEVKIPAIEGKEPSPPETQEEWNGQWKGTGKTVHTVEGLITTMWEGVFAGRTVREGSKIRVTEEGMKEMVFTLTPSNPNAATYKEEKKETLPAGIGWAETVERRTIFIRDGKLYMAKKIEVTSHTQLPGLPPATGKAVNDTYVRADRVK